MFSNRDGRDLYIYPLGLPCYKQYEVCIFESKPLRVSVRAYIRIVDLFPVPQGVDIKTTGINRFEQYPLGLPYNKYEVCDVCEEVVECEYE